MEIVNIILPVLDEHGNTVIEMEASDVLDDTCQVAFKFKTYIPCDELHDLLRIIEEQFELRYSNTDSRFFHVQSFTDAINAAYRSENPHSGRRPIYFSEAGRYLIADELTPSNHHENTLEIDITKPDGQALVFHLEYRCTNRPNRELQVTTEINPQIAWDPIISRFVNHEDSDQYNNYIEMHLANFRAFAREEWQTQQDDAITALINSTQEWTVMAFFSKWHHDRINTMLVGGTQPTPAD